MAKFQGAVSSTGLSDSQLRSVLLNAPTFVQMLDRELRYTFINRGNPGIDIGSLIGKRFGETWIDTVEAVRIRKILQSVLDTGEIQEYEHMVKIDGKEQWYKSSAGPITEAGKNTGVVITMFEISREKAVNEDLKRQRMNVELARQRDRALFNSIGEGLLVINEEGKISNVNPSAAKMLGYRRNELIGRWFTSTIPALTEGGEPVETIERPAIQALSTGKPVSIVARYLRKDGSPIPVSLTVSPVVFKGKPIGVIEVFRDISYEYELDQAKEEFVALASHQLRTPATGVKVYLSMLLDGYVGEMTPAQREYIQKVFESNERQLQIVNDILNVARLDSGRLVANCAQINLSEMITRIADEQSALIAERQQQLVIKQPDKPVLAEVDAGLIHMAIENLLSNASKFTPVGGKLSLELSEPQRNWVRILVTDTGEGIDQKDMARLFQRFSRIESPLGTLRGGTGLGLYLAKRVIELHDGEIEVSSRVGKGTTFTISLPLKPAKKRNTDIKEEK
jgi:two-component system phosphate regulon sensor histidine kinase PhoR